MDAAVALETRLGQATLKRIRSDYLKAMDAYASSPNPPPDKLPSRVDLSRPNGTEKPSASIRADRRKASPPTSDRHRQLENDIAEALRTRGALSAKELCAHLKVSVPGRYDRLTKSQVNSTLYGSTGRFAKVSDSPPVWSTVTAPRPDVGGGADTRDASRTGPQHNPMTVRLPKLYPWQEEALRNWRAAGHSGVVEAVTGTGKTMVGVAAAVQVRQAGGHVLVVVPTVELLGQWRHQLRAVLPGARIGVAGHVA